MPLLLNTEIDLEVKRKIKGLVARTGGKVNQLIDYRGCRVEDINLLDGGFGQVAALTNSGSLSCKLMSLGRYARQELRFLRFGPSVPRDRKTIISDLHQVGELPGLAGRYDASVSSNVLEHSPNPVLLLLNFYLITKEGGWQFHAIPHYKYTYDKFRSPTPVAHLLEDFINNSNRSDQSHNQDYIQSAIEKHGWQRQFHEKYPVQYPYMHFHVFDELNTSELISLMFKEVTVDLLLVDGTYSDNVTLFRNELNKPFVSEHQNLILRYVPALTDRVKKALY